MRMIQKDGFVIPLIVVAAILFRLLLMRYRFVSAFDEINHLKLAASGSLAGFGNVFHTYWSPLYPFMVAVFSKFIPNFELAGRLFSILCGSVLIVPLYLFVRTHFNRKIAVLSVLWSAFYPVIAFHDTGVFTESLYTLLVVGGVFTGWHALLRKSWLWAGLAGILFGLGYLTRPEGVGFLMVFMAISLSVGLYQCIRQKSYGFLLMAVIGLAGFTLMASPYWLFLHRETGKWVISTKISNQQGEIYAMTKKQSETDRYRILNDDNTQLPLDQLYHIGNFNTGQSGEKKPLVRVTIPLLLRKYVKNLYKVIKEWIPKTLTSVLFILITLGLWGLPWNRKRLLRECYLLCFISFFWFGVIPMFHATERYFLPFFPLCFIWAGKGIETLTLWLKGTLEQGIQSRKGKRKKWINALAGVLILLFVLSGAFFPELGQVINRKEWMYDYWGPPGEQKQAGLWLREHAPETPIIMSRYHTADFYAGNYDIKQTVEIPLDSLDRVRVYARSRNVRYLLLNERYIQDNPNMLSLFNETDVPDYLKMVYKQIDPMGLKTLIYEFIDDTGSR